MNGREKTLITPVSIAMELQPSVRRRYLRSGLTLTSDVDPEEALRM